MLVKVVSLISKDVAYLISKDVAHQIYRVGYSGVKGNYA